MSRDLVLRMALAAALLPELLAQRPVSPPIAAVAIGALAFSLPLGLPDPDPIAHSHLAEKLAEFVVIISLMGVGLKLDRPFSLRTWTTTWRLLVIVLPLTVAGAALLGWWGLGFVPATALLLGAVLAPTDPVLAGDVQVGPPLAGREHPLIGESLCTPTMLEAGTKENVVPEYAKLTFDRRFLPSESVEDLDEEMEALFDGLREEGFEVSIERTRTYEAAEIDADHEIATVVRRHAHDVAGVETDVALGERVPRLFRDAGLSDVRTRTYYHEKRVAPPYDEHHLESAKRKVTGEGLDAHETELRRGLTASEFDALRQEWREMGRAVVEQMASGDYRRVEVVPFEVTVGRVREERDTVSDAGGDTGVGRQ